MLIARPISICHNKVSTKKDIRQKRVRQLALFRHKFRPLDIRRAVKVPFKRDLTFIYIRAGHHGLISPAFYEQLLCSQITEVQKRH